MPYIECMKVTMHIDDELLARVVVATGAASKTAAVDLALREMDRRAELKRLAKEGLGLDAMELKETFESSYDLAASRKTEAPVSYARKSRSH